MKRLISILILIFLIITGCNSDKEVTSLDNKIMNQISEKEEEIIKLRSRINQKDEKIKYIENQNNINIKKLESKYKSKLEELETQVQSFEKRCNENSSEKLLNNNFFSYYDSNSKLYGFKDNKGMVVIPSSFDNADDFSEGLAAVKRDNKWGYIDKNGKIIIDFQFDYACSFSNDIAAVNILGEWGYIYKTGVMVIQPQFDMLKKFKDGKAIVKIGGRSGFVDKTGQTTWNDMELYEEGTLLPIDEANQNDSFKKFKGELINAINKRDIDFLIAHIDENIMYSFGDEVGVENFINAWKLKENPKKSGMWIELSKILTLGSKIYESNETLNVWIPYVFTDFPDKYDGFEYSVCIDKNVDVYSKPSLDANVIAQLNYNIVKNIYGVGNSEINNDGLMWCKIQLPQGERGYVNSEYIRSPIDYRASFILKEGIWKMDYFIAGD